MKVPAFTLIETMLAVLLMALLTAAAALTLSQPIRVARTADAVELVRSLDTISREAATTSNHNVRLLFDLAENKISRLDGPDLHDVRSSVSLPAGCHVDAMLIAGERVSSGQAMIDISTHGWSRSYAVHLQCPAGQRWLVFAGLTGCMAQVKDESQIPTYRSSQRYHAD